MGEGTQGRLCLHGGTSSGLALPLVRAWGPASLIPRKHAGGFSYFRGRTASGGGRSGCGRRVRPAARHLPRASHSIDTVASLPDATRCASCCAARCRCARTAGRRQACSVGRQRAGTLRGSRPAMRRSTGQVGPPPNVCPPRAHHTPRPLAWPWQQQRRGRHWRSPAPAGAPRHAGDGWAAYARVREPACGPLLCPLLHTPCSRAVWEQRQPGRPWSNGHQRGGPTPQIRAHLRELRQLAVELRCLAAAAFARGARQRAFLAQQAVPHAVQYLLHYCRVQ